MHGTPRRFVVELLLLAVLAVVTFFAAAALDLSESFTSWARRHEELELDELSVVSVVVMFGLGAFGWFRYREAHDEARRSEQTLDSLLETSDRYRSLFIHNPHAVFSLDLEGRFVTVNAASQGLSGFSETELVGMNFADLMAPGHLEESVNLFLLALSGKSQALDTSIIRSTGEQIDVAVKASPIVVKDTVVGVYGVAEDITAARRMERDLQRTQAAVAATLDGVLIGDENHRVVYANSAAGRLHGYASADQMVGQPIDGFFDTAQSDRSDPTVTSLVDTSGRWTGQLLGRRCDHTTFVAETSMSVLPDGCLVAIVRDVTARVEADAALRTSEERYRAVLADIAGGYYETDLAGNLVYLNDASAAILGRPREEVLGTGFHRYATSDAVATLREHASTVHRTGVTDHGFDWHIETPYAGRRLVSMSIAAVRGDNGKITGLRGMIHDVTDRHQAQRALALSEERHRLITRVTREVIWDGSLDFGKSTLSGAIGDLFGFANDTVEVDEHWWRARIHPEDLLDVFASATAAFESSGDQWVHEYRLRDQSGRYLSVLARGLILRDETGRAVRFVGSLMDITQRRLDEEELRLARRAAEDATEAKSLFLANMSHEIRTPLTSVIAGTELVLDSPLGPHQQRIMGRVRRAGERLLKLVDDLLDFSRIEAGQIRVDTLPFDPALVITQTAAWARETCIDKGIEFRLTMPDSISQPLVGDPHRLSQVLTNLISNAVKFTSAGQVHLSVGTMGEDARTRTLSFTVEDTGTGISEDHQSHIFQSFSQADPSITRRFGGSGLGLAIAKNIVEFMGGTIGVESQPGQGSRFFFEVPFAIPTEAPSSSRPS